MYFLASVMLTLVAINGVHAAVTSTAFSTATPSPNPSERSANPPETARTIWLYPYGPEEDHLVQELHGPCY
ncbi:hypothetical protein EYZ11_011576 [Aspergillus tanneri]|uniref:Uncharacterized protein n=1 Tax=Aspergillus tanneri TaxID=1220188 RepID=A0A4S3J4K9_9EURO|nr:hypothetical protein EYZ11_011576 [Aspergillus tanneri]